MNIVHLIVGASLLIGVPCFLGYIIAKIDREAEGFSGVWWFDGWIGVLALGAGALLLLIIGAICSLFGKWVISLF